MRSIEAFDEAADATEKAKKLLKSGVSKDQLVQ